MRELLKMDYDGPPVSIGQELLLDPLTGKFWPRRWGTKRIKRVTTALVTQVQSGAVVISMELRMGVYPR